jgi:hypothetical protein
MNNELAHLDATAQAELVRRRELTPTQLVDAAIARIERLNPTLNAIIAPLFERARAEAASPNLPAGPFRGVPLVLKDLIAHSAGDPYHAGMRFLRDCQWVQPHDTYLAGKSAALDSSVWAGPIPPNSAPFRQPNPSRRTAMALIRPPNLRDRCGTRIALGVGRSGGTAPSRVPRRDRAICRPRHGMLPTPACGRPPRGGNSGGRRRATSVRDDPVGQKMRQANHLAPTHGDPGDGARRRESGASC